MRLRCKLSVLVWLAALLIGTANASASTPATPSPDDLEHLMPVTVHPAAEAQEAIQVIVEPGDCLWNLAKASLVHPTNAETLAATLAWYQSNRDTIGDDPNLILPDQVLNPPLDQE